MGAVINVNTRLFLHVIIQPQPKESPPKCVYIPSVGLFMVTFTFVYSAFVLYYSLHTMTRWSQPLVTAPYGH